MNLQRTVFSRLYRQAPTVESLPWHREQPPGLLERVVAQRSTRGHALDVGCGEGVYASYLAGQGFSVVGIDFVPAALVAAKARLAHVARALDEKYAPFRIDRAVMPDATREHYGNATATIEIVPSGRVLSWQNSRLFS